MSKILLRCPNGTGDHLVDEERALDPAYAGWERLPAADAEMIEISVRRQQIIARLKVLRDEKEFGVVTTPQGVLQVDERSQGRISRAVKLGETWEKMERRRVASEEEAKTQAAQSLLTETDPAKISELTQIANKNVVSFRPFVAEWRMWDNTESVVDLKVFDDWALLMGLQVQHVFARYGELYTQVQAATSLAELEAIRWSEGWSLGGP